MTYIGLPLKDPSHPIPYEEANDTSSYNGCAQAAVASLVMYYRQPPYYVPQQSGADLVTHIYKDHPPDTPGGKLGTSPGSLEKICKAAGFPKTWRTYSGPITPGNDQNNYQSARKTLLNSLKAQEMVIVLLDLAAMLPDQDWLWQHYAIVYGFDTEQVYLTNMPMVPGGETVQPADKFFAAWHCHVLVDTELQYAAVVVPAK
jgi:hypothetical protein